MHLRKCACGGQRSNSDVVLQEMSTLFLENKVFHWFTGLKLTDYSRQAGQRPLGVCLSLPSLNQDYKHRTPRITFYDLAFVHLLVFICLFFDNFILAHNTFWFHSTPIFSYSSPTSSPSFFPTVFPSSYHIFLPCFILIF